ncbi:MAG: cysteine--tRNA ligase [Candidatus Andersenbacteria bacterium]
MHAISLYNSKSRRLEPLKPVSGSSVVFVYNCGPTVYKRQHIGNMRRFLNADFLKRTLELFEYDVKDITNITDVGHLTQDEIDEGEDKLEKEAKAQQKSPQDIAEYQTKLFFQDIDTLNIERSTQYPKATEHIEEMIDLIQILLDKKHAYITESGIYFDISTFPNYGKLSGNSITSIDAGHRVAVRSEKRNPEDFALWMFDSSHVQLWDSPWGKGYPGWHIECSAMSMKYLGETIDIHTGGEDNRFPHHENEIAQSEGATGKQFVNIWMHNRHLMLSGKKMAKREGETITLDTLKEKNYSPMAFRMLVFAHHYRSPIDFSWELLDEFQGHVESAKRLLERLPLNASSSEAVSEANRMLDNKIFGTVEEFKNALMDDLNTSLAFSVFLQTTKKINVLLDGGNTDEAALRLTSLIAMNSVLGVLEPISQELELNSTIPQEIIDLSAQREQAKQQKDYAKADMLRDQIEQAGYTISDTPNGPKMTRMSS